MKKINKISFLTILPLLTIFIVLIVAPIIRGSTGTNSFDCDGLCPSDDCDKCCKCWSGGGDGGDDGSPPIIKANVIAVDQLITGFATLNCLNGYTTKACSGLSSSDADICGCSSSDSGIRGYINDIKLISGSTCDFGWESAGAIYTFTWGSGGAVCFKLGDYSYAQGINDIALKAVYLDDKDACPDDASLKFFCGGSGFDVAGSYWEPYSKVCSWLCKKTGQSKFGNASLTTGTTATPPACPSNWIDKGALWNGALLVSARLCVLEKAPPSCNLRNTSELCTIEGASSNCSWCPVPKTPAGLFYPYVLPNQFDSVPDANGLISTCIDKTNDPFNCGGCGFYPNGTHKYFAQAEGGLCKANTPFCANKICVGGDAEGAADSAQTYRDLHPAANPYFQPYGVSCDPAIGCKANIDIAGFSPVFSYQSIDDNAAACAAGGGTLTDSGCCGNGKCRSDGDSICQTTKICDGTRWHSADNEAALGEVFKTNGCFNSFPIASVGGELIKCVDEDKHDAYAIHIIRFDTSGCLPVETANSANVTLFRLCNESTGCPSEGKTEWVNTGNWPYACPTNFYLGASVRIHGSEVGPALEPGCGLHDARDGYGFLSASLGGYLVCLGNSFGFASLINTGARGLSFKNMEFTEGEDSTAYCPAPIKEWKEYESSRQVNVVNDALIPCPGKKTVDSSFSAESIYAYGGVDDLHHAMLCVPGKQIDGWQEGLYALDYVPGNGSKMGTVSDHDYLCYTDYSQTQTPGLESSRAKVAICCGSQGCGDIKGSRDSSVTKSLNPGQFIVTNTSTLYCLESGNFSSDLDSPELQDICTKAGLKATGNYCCSEKDDRTSWLNESYNDYGSSIGVCFKGQFQPNSNFLIFKGSNGISNTYQNVFVQNGNFYGCGLPKINISMLNISGKMFYENCTNLSAKLSDQCLASVRDWPDPAQLPLSNNALIHNADYCTLINTTRGGDYCSYTGDVWTQTYENLSHKSEVPSPLMDYLKNKTGTNDLRNASCCLPNQCWDPAAAGGVETCINEQLAYNAQYKINDTAIYKCLQGAWVNIMGSGQKTPNGCYAGFCPNITRCLYNIAGNPLDNGNVNGNPQCINDTQYIKDNLCQNGNWTSRTKLLAMELISLAKSTDKFTLMCGAKEDVLIDLPFAAGKTNNYCALNLNSQRIIGTTINQQFYNSTNHTDFITTVEQNFLISYPGAKFNFDPDCVNKPDFALCVDNPYLKLYFDNKSKMVVFSDQKISGLTPSLWEGVCSDLPAWLSWMGWLCPKPSSLEKNLEGLQLFNKLYATNSEGKKIFGVGENACRASSQPAWLYSFNYTGFSVSELSFLNISEASSSNVVSIFLKNPPTGAWNALTLLRNPEE